MFGRNKTEVPVETGPAKPGGKGRPTPTRRDAEAARKARAQVPRTRKEQSAQQRRARVESSQSVRAAMKAGDERYYLPRDQGPVRRFVRDFVDTRFSLIELMIPLLLVTMVMGYSGRPTLATIGNTLLFTALLVVIADMVLLRVRLKRQVAARFPDQSTKGLVYYAVTRSLQMKFMRLPKAKVKIGQDLPEHYR
ncbi:MAG: DUF3043 domain-containing protein [Nocardioides sp.]|nr:DUF3043 domain-containing protein [Nocardioides sp.]